jgi:hypothetical protein
LFLLVLFIISSTPRIYFHDIIANHKDDNHSFEHFQKVKACFHQKGFNCQVNDLVVSTPYLSAPDAGSLPIYSDHVDLVTIYYFSSAQDYFIYKESRGPPAA